MLSSITPLGERGRASRWPITVTAYVLASAVGGALTGALFGGLGALLPLRQPVVARVLLAVLAVAAGLAMLVELGRLPRLPTWQRQVDEDWLHRYRGWVYGAGYGFQLGAGLVTIVTSPVLYAALAVALLSGSIGLGALLGLTFGAFRALPVLTLHRVRTATTLAAVHRRLESLAPLGRMLAAAALADVAAAATAQLIAT